MRSRSGWIPPLVASVVLAAAAALLPRPAAAAPRNLKVLILYDMEGVSEATGLQHTNFDTPDYRRARISLTADVNAAITGLKAAGVGEIVVVDGHGSGNVLGPDVLEDQLLAPARMIARDAAFDVYMSSYDHSIDAIVAIAMHAGAGNDAGFLSHTYSGVAREYRVNGVPFNETMLLAMGAALMRIPVIAVSGDDQLEKEVRRHLPWVQYATVKHAVNRSTAQPFERAEIDRRIAAAARTGIEKLDEAGLPELVSPPYRFAITFRDGAEAANAALFPDSEVGPDARTVQVRSDDFEEGYRKSLRLLSLAGAAARETAMQAVMASAPDGASWRARVSEWSDRRFLGTAEPPPASPSPVAAGKARYFGAR